MFSREPSRNVSPPGGAVVSVGGGERLNDAGHGAHGSRWLDALWLDARFSLRMLLKHRGLTMVAGFAMAVAIAVGTTAFETISGMLDSKLPFPGGERFVQLQFVGADGGGEEEQLMHEFAALRGQLRTVAPLSAYTTAQHNLVAAETAPEPVEVAEITPSAFAITNTAPLLGRYLLPSDEADAASPVVVVAYQAWQLHFARDSSVVGRTVHLGGVPRTVVGVMPEGFGFPSSNEFWIPLRVNPLEYPPGGGPSLEIFGRLAPGVTIEQAQAEFAGLAQPMAAARAKNSLPLRPVVVPYTQLGDPIMLWALRTAQLVASALTVLVAINLAILVYGRTVARLGELAVRSALGASRRRILTQLFIEAFALALVGAAAGLGIAAYALDAIQTMNETGELLPYWISFALSPRAIIVALGLAVLSALIIGVVPGLKATGVGLTANLHELHGRSGTRLGVTWTALIVAQVAVAVAVLPAAVFISARVIRGELVGTGFPAESIVTGEVGLGPDAPKVDRDRLAAQQRQLFEKLEAEPGVTGVAFSAGVQALNSVEPAPELKGYKIVAAYPKGSADIESSTKRIPGYTEEVKKMGVEIVNSIDELLKKTDVILLETNDGRPHLEQAIQVLKAGKPMFIDKPVAGSLKDVIAIYDAAKKYNVPIFSSSSLRYMESVQSVVTGKIGKVMGADSFSPAVLEKTHPDLFWYGIHGVEILFAVMGTGCKHVTRTHTDTTDVVVGTWADGRIGTFRGTRTGKHDYGGTAYGENGNLTLGPFKGYDNLLVQIINFFRSGKPPVSAEETLEIYAFMEAADESKRNNGAVITLESVMKKN